VPKNGQCLLHSLVRSFDFLTAIHSQSFLDIKSHLVETLNLEWTRSHSALLLPWVHFLACFFLSFKLSWAREEVTFRWHGGILLEPNTANMTLGQFYAFYSTPSRAPIYLTTVPAQWKTMAKQGKTPTVFLELYIDSTAVRFLLCYLNS
jgi:hypothetical protein